MRLKKDKPQRAQSSNAKDAKERKIGKAFFIHSTSKDKLQKNHQAFEPNFAIFEQNKQIDKDKENFR
ncbi:MAG: hypothetical protein AB1422_14570 [bacterium]